MPTALVNYSIPLRALFINRSARGHLDLHPIRCAAAPVRAIGLLPDNAFQAQLLSRLKELFPALANVLAVNDALWQVAGVAYRTTASGVLDRIHPRRKIAVKN